MKLFDISVFKRIADARASSMEEETDSARDEYQANLYQEREERARDEAMRRLRAAVRDGNTDAMRAALGGSNGYLVGLHGARGYTEQVVLMELMQNHAPLEMLRVFFEELGGRFMLDPQYRVCAFSVLMFIESEHAGRVWHEEEAEQYSLRLEAIVRFLVEQLRMPVRMPSGFCMCLGATECKPLLELAWRGKCWACYVALRQYIRTAEAQHSDAELLRVIVTREHATAYMRYWARRLLPSLQADDADLEALILRPNNMDPVFRTLLLAEGERRAAERTHMRALLMLQAPGAAEHAVMQDPYLSQFIQQQAFEDARF